MCLCKLKEEAMRGVSLSLKSFQNKPNAFKWSNFGPNLVACLPAFGTTAIVRTEACASHHYIQISGVNGKVRAAQKERRRRADIKRKIQQNLILVI